MNAPLPRSIPADVVKREWIEAHIERLIALLDWIDGDPDREPSFGFCPHAELDECEPDEDGEPWLGAPETTPKLYPALLLSFDPRDLPRRTASARGGPEPSRDTGSSQLAWSRGGVDDREADAGDDPEMDFLNPARAD